MTEDKKYLKRQLNQACNSTRCLYQFFIDNAIFTNYHLTHTYERWGYMSYAALYCSTSQIVIRRCAKSYKVYMSLLDNDIIRETSFKLIGKYK